MLNREDFVLLGGDPSTWDRETLRRAKDGVSLVEVQRDQFVSGRESAELVEGGGGWYVRSATSLDDNRVLLSGRFTKAFAVEWGQRWTANSPKRREFFARRSDLSTAEIRDWSI